METKIPLLPLYVTPGLAISKETQLLQQVFQLLGYDGEGEIDKTTISPVRINNESFSLTLKTEFCYYVELDEKAFDDPEDIELYFNDVIDKLSWLILEPDCLKSRKTHLGLRSRLSKIPFSQNDETVVIEVGPRLSFSTPFSTNAVSICHAIGIHKVKRLERAIRYKFTYSTDTQNSSKVFSPKNIAKINEILYDRMTETINDKPLETFSIPGLQREPWYSIPVLDLGRKALEEANNNLGLAWDKWDLDFYLTLFRDKLKRDPTNVECFDLAQSNSEHSRHWFFKGNLNIDGKPLPTNLFKLVASTKQFSNENNVIAFSDNSSAINGFDVKALGPKSFSSSAYELERSRPVKTDVVFTAETHNFPTGVAPFPGAATGTGGRLRDVQAVGKGGLPIAGTAGYAFGNLHILGFDLPWEDKTEYPCNFSSPLEIIIQASNGASDYGNKFGEPLILGFSRSFGQMIKFQEHQTSSEVSNRREWIKPIMFSGGIGTILRDNTKKDPPKPGDSIVKVGGPVYRIGMGGGAASSITIQGDNSTDLDFGAVQRGDPEMEQKMNRIIRSCAERAYAQTDQIKNPLKSIHDQGAGGNGNVLKEIVEGENGGGIVYASKFSTGDNSISVQEIWGAEYQESNAALVDPIDVDFLQQMAKREKCAVDVVGKVTGDGQIVLKDFDEDEQVYSLTNSPPTKRRQSSDPSHDRGDPVNLSLGEILGDMPPKQFDLSSLREELLPLDFQQDLRIEDALDRVLKLPTVGSKRFLTNKVDRSVTGLVAQQQCVGPHHTPLSDFALVCLSHFDLCGAATTIGEQPIKTLINPAAGARLAVTEAVLSMSMVRVTSLRDIKCSANWMWPAKLEGEGVKLVRACEAMCQIMNNIGIAIDGGKDSLSMAARVREKTVKAPGALVISAYTTVPDVTKKLTPEFKGKIGKTQVLHIDLGNGKRRLGGTALAQCYKQLGNDCPDLDDSESLKRTFEIMQDLIENEDILAGHDISDGGIIVTILEMAFAAHSISLDINLESSENDWKEIFSEEPGLILEVESDKMEAVVRKFEEARISAKLIGTVTDPIKEAMVSVSLNGVRVLSHSLSSLRRTWETTSLTLDRLQANPTCIDQEAAMFDADLPAIRYRWDEEWRMPSELSPVTDNTFNVAIVREEGSNGDREMAAAFKTVGFAVYDVTMTDIVSGRVSLQDFIGLAFVGGFSYGDVFGSAKGWAATILANPIARIQFESFYSRPETFSLGVCNGCQLMALLGWIGDLEDDEFDKENSPPRLDMEASKPLRYTHNHSGRFESRFSCVQINPSPSILLKGMDNWRLGVWVAHGEGRLQVVQNDPESFLDKLQSNSLACLQFVAPGDSVGTEAYPHNPNGSPRGITGVVSPNGRHLALMPHPERCTLWRQWPWIDRKVDAKMESPWMKIFINAYEWCASKGWEINQ